MYWDDRCFVIHFCGCGVPCGLSVRILSSRESSLLWLIDLWVVLVWLCVPCLYVIFSRWDWCVCIGCVSHCVGVGRWVLALACFVCGPVTAVWAVSEGVAWLCVCLGRFWPYPMPTLRNTNNTAEITKQTKTKHNSTKKHNTTNKHATHPESSAHTNR